MCASAFDRITLRCLIEHLPKKNTKKNETAISSHGEWHKWLSNIICVSTCTTYVSWRRWWWWCVVRRLLPDGLRCGVCVLRVIWIFTSNHRFTNHDGRTGCLVDKIFEVFRKSAAHHALNICDSRNCRAPTLERILRVVSNTRSKMVGVKTTQWTRSTWRRIWEHFTVGRTECDWMATMNDGGDEQDAAPNCDERRSVYAAMRSGVFMFICSRSFNASGRAGERQR